MEMRVGAGVIEVRCSISKNRHGFSIVLKALDLPSELQLRVQVIRRQLWLKLKLVLLS